MVVRVQTLDGSWETVGVDRLSGVFPEQVQLTANTHGSDTARFVLRRDPGAIWPDLSAFTPCEIEEAGEVVWSGRIWETPTKEGPDSSVSVEGRGWQYHLDDQPFAFPFVRARMDFKDMRASLTAPLANLTTVGQVAAENGATVIGWAKGSDISPGHGVGVTYDLGPGFSEYWPWIFSEVTFNGNASTDVQLYLRQHESDSGLGLGAYDDLYPTPFTLNVIGTGNTWYFDTPASVSMRYLHLFLWYVGVGGTWNDNQSVQIKAFKTFGKGHYKEMRSESQLRASDVIEESVARAAPLLKQPTIRSGTFRDEVLGNTKLLAYWDFQSVTGASIDALQYDQSPNGHYLAMVGTPLVDTGLISTRIGDEPDDLSALFSGDDWGTSGTVQASSADFSVAMLWQPHAVPQTAAFLFHHGSSTTGWGLTIGGGGSGSTLQIVVAGITYIDTGITLVDEATYLTIIGYDKTSQRFNVISYTTDGAVHGSFTSSTVVPVAPVAGFYVGANNLGASLINASIGRVAVFNSTFDHKAQGSVVDGVDQSGEARLMQASLGKQNGTVQRTGFWIPELPMTQAQTPREVIDAANTFHDYCWKVNHDPTVQFYAKPVTPLYDVGVWSGAEFEDASANSGEEIYNEVVVEATDYLENPLVARRGGLQPLGTHSFTNGDFETNTTGWSVTNGTIATNASFFHSGAKSALVTSSAGASPTATTSSFTGLFQDDRLYRIVGWMHRDANAGGEDGEINVQNAWTNSLGNTIYETVTKVIPGSSSGFWFPFYIDLKWPKYGTLTFSIQQNFPNAAGNVFYIDDLQVWSLDESLPSRRGFLRTKVLPVQAALNQLAADRIGDVWLEGHTSTPFKGALRHTHPKGVRTTIGGAPVHPATLLNKTCEKIRFTHRIDPDTGDWGREGMIQSVTYDGSTGVSSITIDNSRTNFEAMLARYAAIVGNVR